MKTFSLIFVGVIGALSINALPAESCSPRSGYFYGEAVPHASCETFASYTSFTLGEYFRIPILQGGSYGISTCGASVDTQITGFQGTNTTTETFYNDDNGPYCTGTRSSINYTSTFTDYTRVNINEYNCQALGSTQISFSVRQNNNLTITSSSNAMCEGASRSLTATPTPVSTNPQPGSGDTGTFSGPGVSGSTFTAPSPAGASQVNTIGYTFGFCGVTQDITGDARPTTAAAGADQLNICGFSATLQGNPPAIGSGTWTTLSGPGTATSPSAPNSTVIGLVPGSPTTMEWSVYNGTCSASLDQVSLTVDTVQPVPSAPSLPDVRECFSVSPATPTATDNCSGAIDGVADVSFPITDAGTTLLTWTYEDEYANISTQKQNVTVKTVEVGVTKHDITLVADASGATYQWLNCDNANAPIAGAVDQSFIAPRTGSYAVEVTQNGCVATSECYFVERFSWPMFVPALQR